MTRKTRPSLATALAIGICMASTAALAQYAESDPRSPNHANYQFQERQRAEEESRRKREQEQADETRRNEPQRAEDERRSRKQGADGAQAAADFKAARARLLRMPALPDERNPLLGRWRVEGGAKARSKDDLGQLMGMLANPGRAACKMTFGDGIIEFRSKSWASIDGFGDDSLGPIAYRAEARRVWALPDKGIELMGFDVVDPGRVMVINLDGCALVRVAGATR